ncbi:MULTISPECIES: HalOD1 output domain-containing protein [Natrinema]|uniref:HalOD1 output domain-containing protein n=1 Tax=Natrinema TaxID=88723 RepID=UPI000677FEAD|nr:MULTISPECIES: HalOD1 output domain-containing protein [Natrinema]
MVEGGGSVGSSSQRAPSQAVIEAVAEAEGVSPAAISPPDYQSLHAVVDPAALDALFADRSNGASRPGGTVSFSFCNYDVTVDQDGQVTLGEPTDSDD